MGPIGHALISAPIAAAVWAATGDPAAGAAAFIAGTCIDADHLVDYVSVEGFHFDLDAIRSGRYFKESGRALVLLHSYEVIVAASLIALRWSGPVAAAILLGAAAHLVTDLLFYRFRPACYSLLYRLKTRFALASFRASAGVQGGAATQ